MLAACSSSAKKAADTTAAPAATTATTAAAPATTAAPAATDAATTAPAATEPVATEPAATDAAKPSGTPLLLAVIADASGPVAGSQANANKHVQAWADYINAKGGVNGHPVTIEFRDTAGDPAKAQAAIDELLAKKPVAWVLAASSTESAMAESLGKSGIPVLGTGYNPTIWGGNIESFKLACSTDPGAPVGRSGGGPARSRRCRTTIPVDLVPRARQRPWPTLRDLRR